MKIPPPHRRKFTIPEDFANRTLLDAFTDAFTPPDALPLHHPDFGLMARVRDNLRIREYFRKALGVVEQELKQKQASKPSTGG